jgi:hypothetical protein
MGALASQKTTGPRAGAREAAEVDPFGPADPYAAAESFRLRVTFSATSMEGFYFKPANILVSSLRPVGRRAFTCAHELGHHWFGHGSTIDQLQEDGHAEVCEGKRCPTNRTTNCLDQECRPSTIRGG